MKSKVAEIKTKQTKASVDDFINSVDNEQKRKDSITILNMMKKASGEEPKMWGASLIGFGNKRYKSPSSGREVDWFLVGFSPRKQNLTLYIMHGNDKNQELLAKLGKHKTSGGSMGGCLYINKLSDVDQAILAQLIKASFQHMKKSNV